MVLNWALASQEKAILCQSKTSIVTMCGGIKGLPCIIEAQNYFEYLDILHLENKLIDVQ